MVKRKNQPAHNKNSDNIKCRRNASFTSSEIELRDTQITVPDARSVSESVAPPNLIGTPKIPVFGLTIPVTSTRSISSTDVSSQEAQPFGKNLAFRKSHSHNENFPQNFSPYQVPVQDLHIFYHTFLSTDILPISITKHLKILRISMLLWPSFLQCVVIYMQHENSYAPTMNSKDGTSATLWYVHYVFVLLFLLTVLIEMMAVKNLLNLIETTWLQNESLYNFEFDKIYQYNLQIRGKHRIAKIGNFTFKSISRLHHKKYKSGLYLCYFLAGLSMMLFAMVGSWNHDADIYWDFTAGFELFWVLIIVLYNLDIVKGVNDCMEVIGP